MPGTGPLLCGIHRAEIRQAGGQAVVGELPDLIKVNWERRRDDISLANVIIPIEGPTCSWYGNLRTGKHELHLYRNNEPVWQGPLTRLEFRRDVAEVYASDMLWVAKNKALEAGYNHAYPNIREVGTVMEWLLNEQTFQKPGYTRWNMAGRVKRMRMNTATGKEPETSRAVPALSVTTWEDFDKFAEDSGVDYTVLGRDIYIWDTHYRWYVMPPLLEQYIGGELAVVEYGNEMATRVYTTNGSGKAGRADAPAAEQADLGIFEHVVSSWNEAAGATNPTTADLAAWTKQAQSLVDRASPAPVRIRVSDNTTLLPNAPYGINDLMPGGWMQVKVTSLVRTLEEWHKLDSMSVTEDGSGEQIAITTISGPANALDPK